MFARRTHIKTKRCSTHCITKIQLIETITATVNVLQKTEGSSPRQHQYFLTTPAVVEFDFFSCCHQDIPARLPPHAYIAACARSPEIFSNEISKYSRAYVCFRHTLRFLKAATNLRPSKCTLSKTETWYADKAPSPRCLITFASCSLIPCFWRGVDGHQMLHDKNDLKLTYPCTWLVRTG